MAESESFDRDQVLAVLGNPAYFQYIQLIFLALQYVPLAYNDYMPIFYGILPTNVTCAPLEKSTSTVGSRSIIRAVSTPAHANRTSDEPVCSCPNGFHYEYDRHQWSIIGDMDLICDKAPLVQTATVIFYFGQMVATPIFGWASDRLGRRPILLFSNLLYTAATLALVFSRDYVSFALLRFIVGIARQGMNSCSFVLLMEWNSSARRTIGGVTAELTYSLGVLTITLAAYLLQNWRHIQIFLAAMSILAVPLYWFAPESLSWLAVKNRTPEVVASCSRIAKFNKVVLSEATLGKIQRFAEGADKLRQPKVFSFLDCFRTPNIRKTTLLCSLCWLTTYVGFLGLTYLSSEIATDIYLNLAINGFLEAVPVLFAFRLQARFGNKKPLITYFLVGSLFSCVAGLIPLASTSYVAVIMQNVFAFCGRLCFVGTSCIIFTFASELFPTVIRNNGFSVCSIALCIGCMLAPVLSLMSTVAYKGAGFLIVAGLSLLSAVAAFVLRETTGQPMPDTIDEAESLVHAVLALPDGLKLRRPSLPTWTKTDKAQGKIDKKQVTSNLEMSRINLVPGVPRNADIVKPPSVRHRSTQLESEESGLRKTESENC